mgnify:CR=1 FL=1
MKLVFATNSDELEEEEEEEDEKEPTPEQKREASEALKIKGNALLSDGDCTAAAKMYTQALLTDPSNTAARNNRAFALSICAMTVSLAAMSAATPFLWPVALAGILVATGVYYYNYEKC